jgi:hypothetical protein
MVLRSALLLALAGCAAPPPPAPRVMIEDFEAGAARWKDAGSGAVRTEVAIIDGGVGGRRAARVTISREGDGWSDLTWPVDAWPDGARHIVLWARAPRPCAVYLKVNLGPAHDDLEMWARRLDLAPDWTEHRVPVAELTHFIWGHKRGERVDARRIIGIGFAEVARSVTFEFDRLGLD